MTAAEPIAGAVPAELIAREISGCPTGRDVLPALVRAAAELLARLHLIGALAAAVLVLRRGIAVLRAFTMVGIVLPFGLASAAADTARAAADTARAADAARAADTADTARAPHTPDTTDTTDTANAANTTDTTDTTDT
ncbi:MAG TPA: hypothetical protein VNA66_01525, partial [Gammaproteobacteria bacterium]|nr:hypothetical protein [Gammaproteobacteria bacterium]